MGQRPYAGLSHGQIVAHVTSGNGLVLSSSCPDEYRDLVVRCLCPRPAERPTFKEVLEVLDQVGPQLCSC